MSHAAVETVSPLRDDSRKRRFVKLAGWAAALVVTLVVSKLLGWDLVGWFQNVWDQVTAISFGYLVAGCFFQTAQTTLTAMSWLFILRAAYPKVTIGFRPILAAYAVSVAMNNVLAGQHGHLRAPDHVRRAHPGLHLPRDLRRLPRAEDLLHGDRHRSSTSTSSSACRGCPWKARAPPTGAGSATTSLLTILIAAAAVFLIVLLVRVFWRQVKKLWEKAKVGGAILQRPREYFLKVFLPSFGGWLAKLGVIAVFLAAYGIPVTFDSIMHVVGSNSIANTVSVTPGGVGVNQAMNVIALEDYADADTATAYSIGQQLVTTAWNMVFAIALVCWVFGWTGGKSLVTESYSGAKEKASEQKEQHAEKRAEKKAARKAARRHRHDTARTSERVDLAARRRDRPGARERRRRAGDAAPRSGEVSPSSTTRSRPFIHGGALATCVDTAAWYAAESASPGSWVVSSLRLDCLRLARTEPHIVRATCRKAGRTLAVADVEIVAACRSWIASSPSGE